jgi:copper ion binding protein
MMKKTFHIRNMYCPACVIKLENIEDELDGVQQVSASYHKQTLNVEWDENRVSEEQIKDAVRQKGYNTFD